MYWFDDRLTWNPAEYGNETEIILPSSLLWLPDIFVKERYEDIDVNMYYLLWYQLLTVKAVTCWFLYLMLLIAYNNLTTDISLIVVFIYFVTGYFLKFSNGFVRVLYEAIADLC